MLKPNGVRERLAAEWTRIPSRERLMLALLYFEGLTPTEAARALGCPVREVERTVESRLSKLLGVVVAPTLRSGVARRSPRRKAA